MLDVYADQRNGVVVWFACEDGTRHRLHQPFPTTFYAAGPFSRLRALWKYLASLPVSIQLERTTGEDLFSGPIDVLAATVRNAFEFQRVFRRVNAAFPDLEYYDADIPISIRYAAKHEMFPLVLCEVVVDHSGQIHETTPIENRWDIELSTPALRVLTMRPNVDPHHRAPMHIELGFNRETYTLKLRPERALLISLRAMIKRFDPDLIHTYWGDTWMFPHLFELAEKHDFNFNPNRDQTRAPLRRQEGSYFTYGQVVYRGHQVHLFGRWHIDAMNAVMYGEHPVPHVGSPGPVHPGLGAPRRGAAQSRRLDVDAKPGLGSYVGVFEQARVSSLPVQTTARRSPGAGIMALQFITALKRGVLIPFHKQEAEKPKSVLGLMRADRGGMVYKPTTGLHENVAQLDFDSMYPSIMVAFNVSPETVLIDSDDAEVVPELGISIDQSKRGIVSETLEPLLHKRLEIKKILLDLSRYDCRRASLEARSSALKWLLVVSFGYLGYKRFRWGRIEAHEAVTAYSREGLLRAKEAAEDMGFEVLHMYVDGIWVKKKGAKKPEDFEELLVEIHDRTKLPLSLDGVYRWIVFLPSRLDERVPVPNRWYGVWQHGGMKYRGIEIRRHDTPNFVRDAQTGILNLMAGAPDAKSLPAVLPEIVALLRRYVDYLRNGQIELRDLVIRQTVSRELSEYEVLSAAARAAKQLVGVGKTPQPGQAIRFIYTRGKPGVFAWDLPDTPNPDHVETGQYVKLLLRAASTVLWPLDVGEELLHMWVIGNYSYIKPPGIVPPFNGHRQPLDAMLDLQAASA